MKRAVGLLAAGLAMPAGVAVANGVSGNDGGPPPLPGCKPSHYTPPKCHRPPPPTSSTVTVTVPGTTTTVTQPGTTITQPGTTTTIVAPSPPPTIVVTQGPTSQTVNITITINGVPETITVPGTVPGSKPACKNTLRSAKLGPLPTRFAKVKRVAVAINGHNQIRSILAGRRVNVSVAGLACGTYPIVANDFPNTRAIVPVLRIWTLTGGKGLQRAGFPDPIPPIGLS